MVERLKGKIALVVGAGSIGPGWGNGKATAVAFAREGAKIFCADINLAAAEETARIIRSEGGEAVAHRADVSKAADVRAMVEACASAYDRIDVLDNNVGIAEIGGVVEISEADWDRVFAVNLKSAYLTMKEAIPLMLRQGGGSIINISSIASIRYTGVAYATYYASKAALNQLTKTTAVDDQFDPGDVAAFVARKINRGPSDIPSVAAESHWHLPVARAPHLLDVASSIAFGEAGALLHHRRFH